tara:strand:- start:4369 stop:5328 length:960 start_codon:yes stop_codon:yes gene_type:complete
MIRKSIKGLIILIVICTNFVPLLNNTNASQEVKIVYKINNSIITSTDINNEVNYLMALNEDLDKLKNKEILEIAKDSLIRENIKKNEITKYIDIENYDNNDLVNNIVENIYTRLGLENFLDFESYLKKFDLYPNEVKEKLKIEIMWNQLIAEKFRNQLNIDENGIRKKVQKERINYKNLIEYDLSEIVFSVKNNQEFISKTNEIKNIIDNISFETAANKFSISDTANFGGNIGKINENQLSKLMKAELNKINVNEYTNPINIGNQLIIIKINEKKVIDLKLDENEVVNKMIEIDKKRQYENFSLIYYNKIKLNSQIDEL